MAATAVTASASVTAATVKSAASPSSAMKATYRSTAPEPAPAKMMVETRTVRKATVKSVNAPIIAIKPGTVIAIVIRPVVIGAVVIVIPRPVIAIVSTSATRHSAQDQ